jgi:hypothetical protein
LRALVTRLQGCLGSLTAQSRRLLSLRAGLNGPPHSAGAVAGVLHVSLTRESLLEQLSLVELQTATSSGCAGTSAASTPSYDRVAVGLTGSVPWLPVVAAGSSPDIVHSARSTSAKSSPTSSPPVVSVPAAKRTIDRASTGSHALPAAALGLLAALVVAMSLLVLPGTRWQLLRASGGSAAPPRHPVEPAALIASSRSRTPEPEPEPGPETHNPQAEPEPQVVAEPGPEAGWVGDRSPRHAAGGSWAREHAVQAALAATVIVGGAVRSVRLFTRTRGRRG